LVAYWRRVSLNEVSMLVESRLLGRTKARSKRGERTKLEQIECDPSLARKVLLLAELVARVDEIGRETSESGTLRTKSLSD
jgi:hypothetical protein